MFMSEIIIVTIVFLLVIVCVKRMWIHFLYIPGEGDTGFVVLQPGDDATITITIFNSGGEANFTLDVDSDNAFDFVEHFLDSPTVTVGSNSTVDFLVRLSVFENATDGLASTFTVIARSTLDETNDFVTFQLTVSTRPPPEFIENVSKNHAAYRIIHP